MSRLMLVMLVVGAVLLYLGVQEARLASVAQSEPTAVSCQELGEQGPGSNAHIELTDFLLCDFAFVYEALHEGDAWTTVWVPAVPLNGAYHRRVLEQIDPETGELKGELPLPRNIRVVVKSKHVPDEAALVRLAEQDRIRGLVVNEVEKLDEEEKKLLEESYPGVDFDKVWLLEEGRRPAGPAKTIGLIGGGSALVLLVLGLFVGARIASQTEPDEFGLDASSVTEVDEEEDNEQPRADA